MTSLENSQLFTDETPTSKPQNLVIHAGVQPLILTFQYLVTHSSAGELTPTDVLFIKKLLSTLEYMSDNKNGVSTLMSERLGLAPYFDDDISTVESIIGMLSKAKPIKQSEFNAALITAVIETHPVNVYKKLSVIVLLVNMLPKGLDSLNYIDKVSILNFNNELKSNGVELEFNSEPKTFNSIVRLLDLKSSLERGTLGSITSSILYGLGK